MRLNNKRTRGFYVVKEIMLTLLSNEFSAPISASCAPMSEIFKLIRMNIPSDVTLKFQKKKV